MAKRRLSDVRALMAVHKVTRQELAAYLGLNRETVGAVLGREDDVADRWYAAVEEMKKP